MHIVYAKSTMPELEQRRLTSEQKTGFVLLLIFGFLSVGLGFVQMRQTIYSSLYLSALEQEEEGQIKTFFDEETKLQQIDTDQDGINDYEELTFHETSPYIPDTDSDGFSDKTEIDRGTDPLCAEGDTCQSQSEVMTNAAATSSVSSPLLSDNGPLDVLAAQLGEQEEGQTTDTTGEVDTQRLLTDASYARQILLSSGQLTAEQIQSIDDTTLLQAVKELMTEQSTTQTQ
jgi:hypothetical protein